MTTATHIIWTTYGTWLPGDDRGHWSPLFDLYGHLLAKGHQLNVPDPTTHARSRALMHESPKMLNQDEIEITADVIDKITSGRPVGGFTPGKPGPICRPIALAIEPTHIHLMVGPLDDDLEATVGRLKGVSSSLILALPHNHSRSRTWTTHFWRVFIYDNLAMETIYAYIIAHNTRAGRPVHPWPFTRPLYPI